MSCLFTFLNPPWRGLAFLAIAAAAFSVENCAAQSLTTLYSFQGNDGAEPFSGLTLGTDGNFYGTTPSGGGYGQFGTIFRISPAGVLTTLYRFGGSDGASPFAGLTLGTDGNFYGVTYGGGLNNAGSVFSLTASGVFTTLHNFNTSDGANPLASLALGSDGQFYGTTTAGGSYGQGVIFSVSTSGAYKTLYSFSGPDGSAPYAALVAGPDGAFYGTTESGGANTYFGTVFRFTTAGVLTTLYSFGFADGSSPYAGLVPDNLGNLYGSAFRGGSYAQFGAIFAITTAGGFSSLHNFAGSDGWAPESALTAGADGNYYAASVAGSASGAGSIFKIGPSGTFTSLYSFSGPDGANPTGALLTGPDGNFYGTSSGGGVNGAGTIFRLVVCPACVRISPGSSQNPSPFDSTLTLTASVSSYTSSAPTGSVTFSDGPNPLGSVSLTSGTASLAIAALAVGQHAITISYSGDATFQPSSAVFNQTVTQISAPLSLSSSANPSTFNQPITLNAQAASGATGSVTFSDAGIALGVAPVTSGTASLTLAALGAGIHALTAAYSGDADYQPASAALSQTVALAPASVALTANANPAAVNQQITLSAVVTSAAGGQPSGAVTFFNNGTALGAPAPIAAGQASLLTSLAAGAANLTATYSGDANYFPAAATLPESVTPNSLTTLYSFSGPDGSAPAGLIQGADGNDYGTTQTGGANGLGTIFRISPQGALVTLYSFSGADGAQPAATLTPSPQGGFFGTTSQGGANGYGSIFSLAPGGAFASLYSFSGPDGATPLGALTLGPDGNLYGVTSAGGVNGAGEVFQLTQGGAFTALYSFSGPDGAAPNSAVVFDPHGNLYGTTPSGGTNAGGTVYRLAPDQTFTTLHQFTGVDGAAPSGLMLNADGNLYGVTSSGGANGQGTVFELTPDGSLTVLYSLSGPNGSNPQASLVRAGNGSLYVAGGVNNGDIFKIDATGVLSIAYVFVGNDGSAPGGSLVSSADGSIYGTTASGGAGNAGSIFRLVDCSGCDSITVSSNQNPSVANQPIAFTISIATAPGSSAPTGSMTLWDGAASLGVYSVSGNTVTSSPVTLTAGVHSISASYSGDAQFQPAAATFSQTVNAAAVNAALSTSVSPSALGQPVTFTAHVTPAAGGGTPTGAVTFLDGASVLGIVALSSGSATLLDATLTVGSHAIALSYGGDSSFQSATAALAQIVNPGASSTVVTATPNPQLVKGTVSLNAVVAGANGGNPTGSVTFFQNSAPIGSAVTLVNGKASASTSFSKAGVYTITASYSGDANFASSGSAPVNETVNATAVTTSTTIQTSGSPSFYGSAVTFTAAVKPASGAIPDGEQVTFFNGSVSLGSALTHTGTAALSVSTLPVATNRITASYAGDAVYRASTSAALQQVVSHYTTTTTVTSNLNPSVYGSTIKFTATVASNGPTPSGTITFKNGATTIGTGALSSGAATLTIATLAGGTASITAVYGGDSFSNQSTSATLSQVISAAPVKVTIASSKNPSTKGQSVAFSATVSSSAGLPTGVVVFTQSGTTLGHATLSNGAASLSIATLPSGSDTVTASYSPTANFAGGSASLVQIVH